jgi:hypothetical protein
MRFLFTAAMAVLVSPVLAQESAPSNVNDCTLLQDAGELRRCIESFEGRGPAFVPPVATAPGPPSAGRKTWLPATMRDRSEAQTKNQRGHIKSGADPDETEAERPREMLDLRDELPPPERAEGTDHLDIR